MAELGKSGVEFYSPSEDERAQWVELGGHQRPEWDDFKVDLTGSVEAFERLRAAAEEFSGYYVQDA
jgi:hypothetical protein